jgi:hypothetical protein
MNLANQIVTIAAVVAGAGATYLVTALGDRARERREVTRQWVDRKLQAYTQYANDVKSLAIVARQITAEKGLHDAAPGLTGRDGIVDLDEAEVRRSASYEAVKLLGDASTLRATRELNDAAHRLEWIAKDKQVGATPADWERCWHLFADAADEFRRSVRAELGIPGAFLPRGEWVPPSLPPAHDRGAATR